jgi:hypothetical protein
MVIAHNYSLLMRAEKGAFYSRFIAKVDVYLVNEALLLCCPPAERLPNSTLQVGGLLFHHCALHQLPQLLPFSCPSAHSIPLKSRLPQHRFTFFLNFFKEPVAGAAAQWL